MSHNADPLCLHPGQKEAIDAMLAYVKAPSPKKPWFWLSYKFGTGGTVAMRAFLDRCREDGLSVAVTAPTGKAAKHIETILGIPVRTVHASLYRYGPDKMPILRETSIFDEHDAVFVDEGSMLDRVSGRDLIGRGRPVIFLADKNQARDENQFLYGLQPDYEMQSPVKRQDQRGPSEEKPISRQEATRIVELVFGLELRTCGQREEIHVVRNNYDLNLMTGDVFRLVRGS